MDSSKKENGITEKKEISSSNNSKPPQFYGKKGDKYLMWKIRFEVDQTMKGLYKAFQPNLESKLPSKKKETLDLEDKGQKKQHNAVVKNKKAMMQLALSFTQVSLMNKLNCEKHKDKDWPTRKAHQVMSALIKEFKPKDTMAKMEMK
jgi:hypothetical protein